MKANNYFFLRITIFLFLFSCNSKSENANNVEVSMNQPSRSLNELKELIAQKGDVNAYEELSVAYLDFSGEQKLYWSLIMANKFNYPPAYIDVYQILLEQNSNNLDSLDNRTQTMALDYLKLAAGKGNKNAKKILGSLYIEGKYLEKNVKQGEKLLEESKQK